MRLRDFGFSEGINEIVAVTFNEDGSLNTAPMGVIVDDASSTRAKIRLYASHTRRNIARGSDVYANVVRDAVVFALAAFDDLSNEYFASLDPPVLKSALAWCKFKANLSGAYAELELVDGKVLCGELRAVNRGFSAVIEALVHATRYLVFRKEEFKQRILYYKEICEKCGSEREKEAFRIILEKTGLS